MSSSIEAVWDFERGVFLTNQYGLPIDLRRSNSGQH